MGRLWRGVVVVLALVLGGAAPVVAQSWYDAGDRGGYGRGYYPQRRAARYNDGYIRSGRDWPRPGAYRTRRYDDDAAYGRYAAPGYRCTVRHVYYDADLDRYTVVHRPAPCRDGYRYDGYRY
jgi:hypothetical protein